jgi:hypothetical protein
MQYITYAIGGADVDLGPLGRFQISRQRVGGSFRPVFRHFALLFQSEPVRNEALWTALI